MDFSRLLDQETLTTLITTWGLKLLAALAVLILGWLATRALVGGLRKALQRSRMEPVLVDFLGSLAKALLLTTVIIIALTQMGVQMTAALAVLGAMGLAVGLALQGSLSNFAAGVMIIGFRPLRQGDFVECAGVNGTVEQVGIFYTQLRTPDNQQVTVSNAQVLSDPITNYTAWGTRRFNEIVGISYDDDIGEARRVIGEVLERESRLLDDPPPQILMWSLGESSVDLAVRCWTKTDIFWDVRSDLLHAIKTELEAAGITIPFPQREVHHRGGDTRTAA